MRNVTCIDKCVNCQSMTDLSSLSLLEKGGYTIAVGKKPVYHRWRYFFNKCISIPYTYFNFLLNQRLEVNSKFTYYDPKCLAPITVQKYIRYIEEWHQDAFYAILYDHLCVVSSVVVSKTRYVLCSVVLERISNILLTSHY